MPEEKRQKVEKLIRDIAENAEEAIAEHDDWPFYTESRGMAMGIARATLAFGYERDWEELTNLVDELFNR
jgi:hypothetical protein